MADKVQAAEPGAPVAMPAVPRRPRTMAAAPSEAGAGASDRTPTASGGTPDAAGSAAAALPRAPAPRLMPGEVRVGPRTDAEALARRFPQQSPQHLALAARLIGSTPLAGFGWAEAQHLGLAAQNRYGEAVQALLDVVSMDVVRKAPLQLSRLLRVLELCAEDFDPPASTVAQWLRKDRPRQTGLHRNELDQLREALRRHAVELQAPIQAVMALRGRLGALFDELMAWGIACEWLADRSDVEELVRGVLLERAQSVVKTAGLVKAQQAQSLATAGQLDGLRDRIQDAVLIALPSWLAQLAKLPETLNETQRFVVRDDLRQIIHQLKP